MNEAYVRLETYPLLDRRPGRENRQGGDERGQQHEQKAESIHAEEVFDVYARKLEPVRPCDHLHIAARTVELQQHEYR
ncbi:MAG: hypothetical protein P8Z42_15380 [Anaerolineales bacterium]